MGCRMLFKLHVLHSHLKAFRENMGTYSEEQVGRFHQDMKAMEIRYQGQSTVVMMVD